MNDYTATALLIVALLVMLMAWGAWDDRHNR